MFCLLFPENIRDLLRSACIILPTIPFRLTLRGTSLPWTLSLYLSLPPILHALASQGLVDDIAEGIAAQTGELLNPTHPITSLWPPSPAFLGLVVVPILRPIYNRLFSWFSSWVLGGPPPLRQKRYLSERAHAILAFRALPPHVPPIPQGAADEEPAPLVIAAQIVQKDQTSLTHDILHALLSVAVPHAFGEMLCVVSTHSAGLRRFLGVQQRPFLGTSSGVWAYYPRWAAMTTRERAAAAGKVVSGMLLGGSWIWTEVDPVWCVAFVP